MSLDSFLDSRHVRDGSVINTNLCIVGAGAAGITIAKEFANRGLHVCLLESGGLNVDPNVTALGKIESIGRDYEAQTCRLRYFGGTVNHWGGHCVPLESTDFESLDWIDYSGWPYDLNELIPYYERAHNLLNLGDFDYDAAKIATRTGQHTFPFDSERVKTVVSRYNPVRFSLKFGEDLDRAKNISVYLYAEVSSFNLRADSQDISGVTVKTIAGTEFSVRAKQFVLAGGGIENARLLLSSNDVHPTGLGNHSDLVGRFFQDHLWYPSGFIAVNEDHDFLSFYDDLTPYEGIHIKGHLAISESQIRKLRIPKFRSEIAVSSSLEISAEKIRKGNLSINDILTLISSPLDLKDKLLNDKAPEPNAYLLNNYVQQTPNPNSRVMLSSNKNALGSHLPLLDWQLSAIDKEGIIKAQKVIANEVGRIQLGRFYMEIPVEEDQVLEGVGGGCHHMGTTRMDKDPKYGVTDENAKVHHVHNLYVAGSSLFPTCGWPNPTLTIVATSMRLADHLKQMFKLSS